jgi:hypothetical protein
MALRSFSSVILTMMMMTNGPFRIDPIQQYGLLRTPFPFGHWDLGAAVELPVLPRLLTDPIFLDRIPDPDPFEK